MLVRRAVLPFCTAVLLCVSCSSIIWHISLHEAERAEKVSAWAGALVTMELFKRCGQYFRKEERSLHDADKTLMSFCLNKQ